MYLSNTALFLFFQQCISNLQIKSAWLIYPHNKFLCLTGYVSLPGCTHFTILNKDRGDWVVARTT